MKLSNLIYNHEYTSEHCAEDIDITKICSNEKELCRGCVFVCIKGVHFDSHIIAEHALLLGASAVIAEYGAYPSNADEKPIFYVENTRKTLAYMWSRYYGNPQNYMKIIGITGTNGKTSTAFILNEILYNSGHKCGLIGTVDCKVDNRSFMQEELSNTTVKTMTTPDPEYLYKILANMKKTGVDTVVMEVSSHALVQEKVSPIKFEIAIFTNLSPEHLDFHNDMNAYAEAKARIFTLSKHGIVNFDDEYGIKAASNVDIPITSISIKGIGNVRGKSIKLRMEKTEYIYSSEIMRFPVICNMTGVFGVYNSMQAITAAILLGISPVSAAEAVKNMKPVKGRFEFIPTDENFNIIIDYAHTPQALRSLLETVNRLKNPCQRTVLLFGCGGDRDKSKRKICGQTAAELADFIIVTSDNSRSESPEDIIEEILLGIPESKPKRVIVSREAAIRYAIENAMENDIILLVGKGHECYEITSDGIKAFDERKIIARALAYIKEKRVINAN